MHKLQAALFLLICSVFLFACNQSDNNKQPEAHKEENEAATTETEEVWQADWDGDRDNFAEWLIEAKEILEKDAQDERLEQINHDQGFTYYVKSKEINKLKDDMQAYVEGEDIDEDLSNLFLLQSIIEHYQFVRTSHLGLNGEEKENIDVYDDWEPTPEEMHMAFDYMKKLIHDLDIAFNHEGVGDTYGVTYVLNGENVKDLERNEFWTGD